MPDNCRITFGSGTTEGHRGRPSPYGSSSSTLARQTASASLPTIGGNITTALQSAPLSADFSSSASSAWRDNPTYNVEGTGAQAVTKPRADIALQSDHESTRQGAQACDAVRYSTHTVTPHGEGVFPASPLLGSAAINSSGRVAFRKENSPLVWQELRIYGPVHLELRTGLSGDSAHDQSLTVISWRALVVPDMAAGAPAAAPAAVLDPVGADAVEVTAEAGVGTGTPMAASLVAHGTSAAQAAAAASTTPAAAAAFAASTAAAAAAAAGCSHPSLGIEGSQSTPSAAESVPPNPLAMGAYEAPSSAPFSVPLVQHQSEVTSPSTDEAPTTLGSVAAFSASFAASCGPAPGPAQESSRRTALELLAETRGQLLTIQRRISGVIQGLQSLVNRTPSLPANTGNSVTAGFTSGEAAASVLGTCVPSVHLDHLQSGAPLRFGSMPEVIPYPSNTGMFHSVQAGGMAITRGMGNAGLERTHQDSVTPAGLGRESAAGMDLPSGEEVDRLRALSEVSEVQAASLSPPHAIGIDNTVSTSTPADGVDLASARTGGLRTFTGGNMRIAQQELLLRYSTAASYSLNALLQAARQDLTSIPPSNLGRFADVNKEPANDALNVPFDPDAGVLGGSMWIARQALLQRYSLAASRSLNSLLRSAAQDRIFLPPMQDHPGMQPHEQQPEPLPLVPFQEPEPAAAGSVTRYSSEPSSLHPSTPTRSAQGAVIDTQASSASEEGPQCLESTPSPLSHTAEPQEPATVRRPMPRGSFDAAFVRQAPAAATAPTAAAEPRSSVLPAAPAVGQDFTFVTHSSAAGRSSDVSTRSREVTAAIHAAGPTLADREESGSGVVVAATLPAAWAGFEAGTELPPRIDPQLQVAGALTGPDFGATISSGVASQPNMQQGGFDTPTRHGQTAATVSGSEAMAPAAYPITSAAAAAVAAATAGLSPAPQSPSGGLQGYKCHPFKATPPVYAVLRPTDEFLQAVRAMQLTDAQTAVAAPVLRLHNLLSSLGAEEQAILQELLELDEPALYTLVDMSRHYRPQPARVPPPQPPGSPESPITASSGGGSSSSSTNLHHRGTAEALTPEDAGSTQLVDAIAQPVFADGVDLSGGSFSSDNTLLRPSNSALASPCSDTPGHCDDAPGSSLDNHVREASQEAAVASDGPPTQHLPAATRPGAALEWERYVSPTSSYHEDMENSQAMHDLSSGQPSEDGSRRNLSAGASSEVDLEDMEDVEDEPIVRISSQGYLVTDFGSNQAAEASMSSGLHMDQDHAAVMRPGYGIRGNSNAGRGVRGGTGRGGSARTGRGAPLGRGRGAHSRAAPQVSPAAGRGRGAARGRRQLAGMH